MASISSLADGRISRAAQALRSSLAARRRGVLPAVLATVILALAGCGSSHPRTEVLRSANPLTSDMYLRLTGPGGAVSHVAQQLMTGAFSKYNFRKDRREGRFLPPRVLDRKICSSTHTIRPADAPELQKWRGRKITITVYGRKNSTIYCAGLGPGIYQGGS
jgi:hypothetical protein